MSAKIIDTFNSLSFISDYNSNGTSSNSKVIFSSGGVLTLYNTTQSQFSSIGALVLQSGGLSINALTNATSVSNGGALTVAGGASIAGDLIIGGTINAGSAGRSSLGYLTLLSSDQSNNVSSGSLITFGGISVKTSSNATSITSGGGITVMGGVGIAQSLFVGGLSNLSDVIATNVSANTLRSSSTTISNALFTNVSSSTVNVTGLTAQNINFTGTLYQNGSPYVSSQWGTIGGNVVYTTGNVGINTTSPSYNLDINGSLRASGTAGVLHVIATSSTSDIIQVQNTNASGASTLQFLNNSAVSKGTFGFGNANGSQFQNTMFLSSVTGVPINFVAGNNSANPFILNASDNSVSITSTTAAVDTSSGSLKISGGASIRGDLYIGGAVNVNSPLTVNINNTSVSSNSTTGSMKLIGGMSIAITDTTNSNATSYTAGGGITIKGGIAISQDAFIGGILDIQSGSNNMNPVKLQSLQISSNYNNGASTVIQSGDAARTNSSFTPIAFSGYNDQSNPKLTVNASTIVTGNALVAVNNSNTIGPLITTGGKIGIGTSTPNAHLDIINNVTNTFGNLFLGQNIQNRKLVLFSTATNDNQFYGIGINTVTLRFQVDSTGADHVFFAGTNSTSSNELFRIKGTGSVFVAGTTNSVAVSSGNIFASNITVGTLNASSGLTAGNINFTGSLFQNGSLYVSSQWLGTTGNSLYYGTSGNALVGIGTSNPSFNLDVSGTSRITGSITSGAVYATNTTITNARFTNLSGGTINSTGLTTGNINFTGSLFQNGTPYIGSQWSGTTGTVLYYGTTGNIFVGIGTSNPSFTLDINGSLRSTGLTVTSTNPSLNSTTGQFVLGSLSITNTTDTSSFTQGGGLTVAGGVAVGKGMVIGNALSMSGITSDIAGTFSAANNISTATNITGLLFPTANIRSFVLTISIQLLAGSGNKFAHYTIEGIQNVSGWAIDDSFVGDSTGISFSIDASGQLQYTSTNVSGWISNTFNYKSTSYSISGNYIQTAPPTSGNFIVTQNLTVQGTTDSSSASYGSIVTAGGAGIAKSVNVGGSVVINNISATSSGTFNAANGTVTNGSVTNLIFAPSTYRSFTLLMSVGVSRFAGGSYYAQYTIEGILRDTGWNIFVTNLGDTIDLTFSINTSTGQLQYSSTTTYTNWTSTTLNYHTTVLYISGGFSTIALPSGDQTLNHLTITDTTDSSDTSTGSLIVNGGVAIKKNLNIGGGINSNNINLGVSSLFSGSFVASNNVSSPADVTGLSFANTDIRYFEAKVIVTISVSVGSNQDIVYTLRGNQNDATWDIYIDSIGDTSTITFTLTNTGQVQYTSTNVSNFTSSIMRYSVQQFTKSGTYTASPLSTSGSYLLNSAQITSVTDAVSGTSSGAFEVLGGATIAKTLLVGGNVQFSGGIAKTQYYSAQNGDYSAIEQTNSSTTFTTAAVISFTPVATGGRTSQIICQCFYRWRCTGSLADNFTVQLRDASTNILDLCNPTYFNAGGGGGREIAKPLMGCMNTTTTTPITFSLDFARTTSDDNHFIDLTYTKFLVQQIVL